MRIYQGDSVIPGSTRPHTFVEVERDGFLEIEYPKCDRIENPFELDSFRAFVRKVRREEKRSKKYHIRLAYRAFNIINPVPNLKLIGEF